MSNNFSWHVLIDGVNIADLIPDGSATITYGRTDRYETPTPTTATLEIITVDAADYPQPLVGGYPEFTLGDHGIPSGFIDEYLDVYEGGSSRVRLGTDIQINVDTPSGFRDAYVDDYNDGLNLPRFTGKIVALDYSPDRIQATCASPIGALTRTTTPMASLPEEDEADRAYRYYGPITVTGLPQVVIATTAATEKPATVFQALEELAKNSDATIYCDRSGAIIYRCGNEATASITLPPDKTLLEPLRMEAELGDVINHLEVEWGPADNRSTHIVSDSGSQLDYGLREATIKTQLALLPEVEAYAQTYLSRFSQPHWTMPSAEVNLGMCNDKEVGEVAAVDLGDSITIPTLLQSSPADSYTAEALGYTETLSATDWRLSIHLAPLSTPATRRR